MMFRNRLIHAAVAAVLLVPGAALAQPSAQATERVAYGDLDLGADSGAVAMLRRISKAATAVCSRQAESGSSADVMARFETCHRETVARAVEGLGAPSVTAAYQAKPIRLAQNDR